MLEHIFPNVAFIERKPGAVGFKSHEPSLSSIWNYSLSKVRFSFTSVVILMTNSIIFIDSGLYESCTEENWVLPFESMSQSARLRKKSICALDGHPLLERLSDLFFAAQVEGGVQTEN